MSNEILLFQAFGNLGQANQTPLKAVKVVLLDACEELLKFVWKNDLFGYYLTETLMICLLFAQSDETPEFVLINKERDPQNDDPSQQYPEDPLILHTPTGRIINYVEDEEHGIRLFWQPPLKDGEEVDPANAEFLPLGFDEFYGREVSEKKESFWKRLVIAAETACKPAFERFDKWIEEKKKEGEMKMKLIEKELDHVEAEICLEEAIEDMDAELKMREKEEQRKVEMSMQEEEEETSELAKDEEKTSAEVEETEEAEEGEDEEGEEEEDSGPSSFGTVIDNRDASKNGQEGTKPGDLPFAASSLGFYSSSLISAVSSQ